MKLLLGAATIALTVFASGVDDFVRPYKEAGNTIVFTFSDHRDKNTKHYPHTVRITKVKPVNGVTIVYAIEGYTDDGQFIPAWYMQYGYDTTNFFAFAVNRSYPNIPEASSGARVIMEGDSLVYPYKMKVGDSLPGATGTRTDVTNGYKAISSVEITQRFVSRLDTLDLPAGKVPAFKIESTDKWRYVYGGDPKDPSTRHYTEWFSPQYGIVKVHDDLGNGAYTETTLYSVPK